MALKKDNENEVTMSPEEEKASIANLKMAFDEKANA